MNWNVGTKLGAGFGLVLLVFLVVGAVTYQSTARVLEATAWRQHTYEVLGQIEELRLLLREIETGQRGYLLTGEQDYLAPYRAAVGRVDPAIREIRTQTADNPRQQRRLDAVEPAVRDRVAFSEAVLDLHARSGTAAAVALMKEGKGKRLMDQILKTLDEMRGEERALLAERDAKTNRDSRIARWTIVLGTLAALLLSALAGFGITRNIARPLDVLTARAERIIAGDLSGTVSTDGRTDEVGVLGRAFDRMTLSLRGMAGVAAQIAAGDLRATVTPQSSADVLGNAFAEMIRNLRDQTRQMMEGASVLGSAATEIAGSTSELAASASEAAAAVSETTTTVEEVRQTAQIASQKAQQVFDAAQKAALISQNGRKSAEDAGAGMTRIRQQMDAIAASMGRLSEQSQTIGQIIATVEDLAAQSNLLAVNAAIEAAKAGEHGRGFTVVAQEVKSLAMQSRQATDAVRTILGDIQKATTTAVLATEQGTKAVEAGARQTELAGESIHALAGGVTEAAQAATQIAASSQQQLVGVDQVASAMESIRQASTQNVESSRQLEAAARNLSALGQQLKQMVDRYQV